MTLKQALIGVAGRHLQKHGTKGDPECDVCLILAVLTKLAVRHEIGEVEIQKERGGDGAGQDAEC